MHCPCCHLDSLVKKREWPELSLQEHGKPYFTTDWIVCAKCGMKAEIVYPQYVAKSSQLFVESK